MSYKDDFATEGLKKLGKVLGISNNHALPKPTKVVVNVGVGETTVNKNAIDRVTADLTLITAQKPIVRPARKAVSAFKIRKGLPIGVKVTLRGKRMYDFIEKLAKVVLPRIREFKGIVPESIDAGGNLNIGITDQTLFPEVDYDTIDKIRGLQVTIVTSAKDKTQAQELFKILGFPMVAVQ